MINPTPAELDVLNIIWELKEANTSGAGTSPSKDDIGSSSVRKGTMAMASAFGTTQ